MFGQAPLRELLTQTLVSQPDTNNHRMKEHERGRISECMLIPASALHRNKERQMMAVLSSVSGTQKKTKKTSTHTQSEANYSWRLQTPPVLHAPNLPFICLPTV